MITNRYIPALAPLFMLLAGCSGPGELGGAAFRPAGFETATAGEGGGFPTCEVPLGLASVVQPGDEVLDRLKELELGSPEPLLKKMMLDSGCFEVVDLDLVAEHAVKDQLHYMLRPQVTVSNPEAAGANVGRAFGGMLGTEPGGGGNINLRTVETVLFLNDARTGRLVAAAEGTASGADVSGLLRGIDEFDLGAYGTTSEGKVIAAAFADAFGRLVSDLGNQELETASR